MTSRHSECSATEDTFLYCGNCGVKLEVDAPNEYEQLSLKGSLYPQEGSRSVTVCKAFSTIFKVKVPHEIEDAALCYDCSSILQQLYKMWESFRVKSTPSTVFYQILASENIEIDAKNGDSSELLTQTKRPTKARLQAKIARCRKRVQSIQDTEIKTVQYGKRKRPEGAARSSLRRKIAEQRNKVEASLSTPSNITSSLYLYVDTERNGTTSDTVLDKRKRGRPRKNNEPETQTPKSPSGVGHSILKPENEANSDTVSESLLIKSASNSYVLHVELDSLPDTAASMSTNFEYESENDEFEIEDPLQIKVDLADGESENLNASASATSGANGEQIGQKTVEEVKTESPSEPLPNQETDVNVLEVDKVVSLDLTSPSAVVTEGDYQMMHRAETGAEQSQNTTRRSLRKARIIQVGKSQADFSDDSDSSEPKPGESDSDFDPEDIDMRDRKLEKLNQKRLLQRDKKQAERELATNGKISKQFVCKRCGRRFSKKISLDKHINVIHLNLEPDVHYGPNICTFQNCGKTLRSAKELDSHMNKHLGIKPFICDQCAWSTTSNQLLERHLRTHLKPEEKEELKTEVCHVCGAKFTSSALHTHMRVHKKDRPFRCSFERCKATFKDIFKLKRHENDVHLASPPTISCERCGREFIRKDNFIRHIKIHEKYDLSGGKMRKSRDPPVRKTKRPDDDITDPNAKLDLSKE